MEKYPWNQKTFSQPGKNDPESGKSLRYRSKIAPKTDQFLQEQAKNGVAY